jgi:DNA repair protein RadC
MTMYLPEIKISMEPKELKYKTEKIKNSEHAAELLKKHCFPEEEICLRERFIMMSLNRSNGVIGYCLIGIGGRSATIADVTIILQAAIKSNACGVLIAHNHPSGNLNPSDQDRRLTKAVKETLKLVDIDLLDHIIITDESFYSFADNGILNLS